MTVDSEAARIQATCRRDPRAARAELEALLARPARLTGSEQAEALDFNARLVTELRRRGVIYPRSA